ncbi:MAG: hypothetical protein LBD84_01985 [Campylobacteraceae bacterium]|jgi:hypothetical protein|nr:hypothetical protein [Campylobacteraceae bacterium]
MTHNELKEVLNILNGALSDVNFKAKEKLSAIIQLIMNTPHKYLDYKRIKGETERVLLFAKRFKEC